MNTDLFLITNNSQTTSQDTMYPHAPSSVDFTTSSMASHAFSDRTAPPRAPSSVTSHSTKHTRRHHRSSRSHHGGGSSSGGHSHASQNEFPNFAHTGDVEIVVASDGQERRYLLHRLILARCSGFFDASTSEQWSGQSDGRGDSEQHSPENNDLLKPGGYTGKPMSTIDEFSGSGGSPPGANQLQVSTRRRRPFWRYELDHGTDPDDIPMLVRRNEEKSGLFGNGSGQQGGGGGGGGSSPQPRPPSAKSKPPASSNGFFRSITAMQSVVNAVGSSSLSAVGGPTSPTDQQPMNDLVRDYDNMFRIFYNYPPDLDPLSITDAYIQSKTLLMLADMYDALEVVGPRIDHHLLQFQARLWKQIAKYPPSYLKLGYMARSKTIFSEALTHVVGQWPVGQMQLRSMPRPVLDLIEDKADDLDELRSRLEGQLFRLTVVNSRGERAGPQSSVPLDWQAVSLFRHWLAENLPAPPAPILAGFGTTANPNPTGQKSVSFNPQTTTNGRPNSTHAPIPLVAESTLSASAGAGGGGGNNIGAGNNTTTATQQSATMLGSSVVSNQQPSMGHYAAQPTSQSSSGAASGGGGPVPRSSMIPSTGRAFRQLGLAGQAYLTHEELKKHLKQQLLAGQTYDKSLLRRFEKRVDDLKSQAQAVVRPLTRNALQMDTAGAGCQYLTCAGVGEGEWPW